jgi:hypothetical protein
MRARFLGGIRRSVKPPRLAIAPRGEFRCRDFGVRSPEQDMRPGARRELCPRSGGNMRVEQESTVQTRCASKRASGRRELATAQASEPAEPSEARERHRPGRWLGGRDEVDRHVTVPKVTHIAPGNPEGISRRADHIRIAAAVVAAGSAATAAAGVIAAAAAEASRWPPRRPPAPPEMQQAPAPPKGKDPGCAGWAGGWPGNLPI